MADEKPDRKLAGAALRRLARSLLTEEQKAVIRARDSERRQVTRAARSVEAKAEAKAVHTARQAASREALEIEQKAVIQAANTAQVHNIVMIMILCKLYLSYKSY